MADIQRHIDQSKRLRQEHNYEPANREMDAAEHMMDKMD
jgi:hypothetical protein